MANRFLDTNFYKSPFVKSLPPELKAFYSFVICDCTPSGVWFLDFEAVKLYTGFEPSYSDFEKYFIKKGKAVKISAGKFFFPDFIEHQYPGGLSDNNKAHKNILLELRKFNMLNDNNLPIKEAPLEEPLCDPLQGVQGQGLGNGHSQGAGVGQGKEQGEPEKKNEPILIDPQMCELWYGSFATYTKDKENDFESMRKILQFMIKQAHISEFSSTDNQQKILNTLQLIADQVNRTPFWVNKPIKSIANNIQEFYNNIKNPINGNGKTNGTGKQPSFSREGVQAALNERFKNGQQK